MAFQQLFHGNPTNEAVYYSAGSNSNGPLAFITDIKHHDVRTEGLSYGMMICVRDEQEGRVRRAVELGENFSVRFGNESSVVRIFRAGRRGPTACAMSQFVAPDGEEYFVTALYLAAHRWKNGAGIYDYKAQADELLTNMRHRAEITGPVPWRGEIRT